MLTMFNDAKNFPEYRLFIFIRGCIWLAGCYQPEYVFLNGWFSSIFQGIFLRPLLSRRFAIKVFSFFKYTLVILIYKYETAKIMTQSKNAEINVTKYKINLKSEKVFSLGSFGGSVITQG